MGVLDNVTPQQRQIAMIGVPAVAAFALISKFRKPTADASNSEDATATTTSGWTMPSTDAIGTGQLAEFESLVTAGLNNLAVKTEETSIYAGSVAGLLASQVGSLAEQVTTLANKPPPAAQQETYPTPPPVVQPPAPSTYCPNIPGDLANQIAAGGESILGYLTDPVGGGCWWFGSLGGVFAMGGARFLGSARNAGFAPGQRWAVSYERLGNGYRIVSNRGETYNFPG